MKRLALLMVIAGAVGCISGGCAAPPAVGDGEAFVLATQSAIDREETESRVEAKLRKKMGEVAIGPRSVKQVFEWFQQTTNLNVQVQWTVLESAGITEENRVEGVYLTGATVEEVLRRILDHVGGTVSLTFCPEDGVLIVSTLDDLNGPRYRRLRIYNVRDLLPPRGGKIVQRRQYSSTEPAVETTEREEAVDKLIRIITRRITSVGLADAYDVNESIFEYGGLLIADEPWAVHRKIVEFLAEIRRHKPIFD